MKKMYNEFVDGFIITALIVLIIRLNQFSITENESIKTLQNSVDSLINQNKETVLKESLIKNKDNLLMWANALEIDSSEIVLKQAILESSHELESGRNNLFGFTGKDGKLMTFSHWISGLMYYKEWQKKRFNGGDYYKFIKEVGYAEDPLYQQKLRNINI